MSTVSNDRILDETTTIKQQLRELREAVARYQVVHTTHPHVVKMQGHQGGEPKGLAEFAART
jgi:hypothetical protein